MARAKTYDADAVRRDMDAKLKEMGVTREQFERLSDELDEALTARNIYFGWWQFLEFVMLGKGSAEEIADGWENALREDFC